jgi:hypothetical protein
MRWWHGEAVALVVSWGAACSVPDATGAAPRHRRAFRRACGFGRSSGQQRCRQRRHWRFSRFRRHGWRWSYGRRGWQRHVPVWSIAVGRSPMEHHAQPGHVSAARAFPRSMPAPKTERQGASGSAGAAGQAGSAGSGGVPGPDASPSQPAAQAEAVGYYGCDSCAATRSRHSAGAAFAAVGAVLLGILRRRRGRAEQTKLAAH